MTGGLLDEFIDELATRDESEDYPAWVKRRSQRTVANLIPELSIYLTYAFPPVLPPDISIVG